MQCPVVGVNGESYIHSRPSDIGYRQATINRFRIQDWSLSVLAIHSTNSLNEEVETKRAFLKGYR
jgi:hypothetical protein